MTRKSVSTLTLVTLAVLLLPFSTALVPAAGQSKPVWYLAEGSTAWGFNTRIVIANPNQAQVTARVTYMTEAGPRARPDLVLPPTSQTTINPVTENGFGNKDFSTKVECLEGETIAVDRTMSWEGGGGDGDMEIHSSVGVSGPATKWYLPEGSSAWGFETWLLIQNPQEQDAQCRVTYMIEGEGPVVIQKVVPAQSRRTFSMEGDIGRKDASIMVESNVPVVPERSMYRNQRREGTDSIGAVSGSSDYYLAEGSTAWGFTTYLLLQNPDPTPALVTVTYMTPSGEVPQAPFVMDPNSRKTINVNVQLPGTDCSIKVHGSQPILAERSMYIDPGPWFGEIAHDSIGLDSPHKTFYFADGAVDSLIRTWTLVQNPNPVPAGIQVSYLRSNGSVFTFADTITANSRRTYNMGDKVSKGRYSIVVKSLTDGAPIMAERAMYYLTETGRKFYMTSASDTIGAFED